MPLIIISMYKIRQLYVNPGPFSLLLIIVMMMMVTIIIMHIIIIGVVKHGIIFVYLFFCESAYTSGDFISRNQNAFPRNSSFVL